MSKEDVEELLRMTDVVRRCLKARVLRRASYSYLFWVVAFPVGLGLSFMVYHFRLNWILYPAIWLGISLVFAVVMRIWESSVKIYAYAVKSKVLEDRVRRGRKIHKLAGMIFFMMIAIVAASPVIYGTFSMSMLMASIYECVAIMNLLLYFSAKLEHDIEFKEPLLVGILVALGGISVLLFPEQGLLTAIIFMYIPYLAAWISLQVRASRVEAGNGSGEDS